MSQIDTSDEQVLTLEWESQLSCFFDFHAIDVAHKPTEINTNKYKALGHTIDPSPYNCDICFCVMQEPMVFGCGHSFCGGCIKQQQVVNKCAKCDKTSTAKCNFSLKLLLENIEVICPNGGCAWNGKLQDLKHHRAAECNFETRVCPGCKTTFTNKHALQQHLVHCKNTALKCKICNQVVFREQAVTHLVNWCKEMVVPCALGSPCTWTGKRKDIHKHKWGNECAHQQVKCKIPGCGMICPKFALEQHMNSKDPVIWQRHMQSAVQVRDFLCRDLAKTDEIILNLNKIQQDTSTTDNATPDTSESTPKRRKLCNATIERD